MLTADKCWSQISGFHSGRLGIAGERGRLRASSASHPCPWCDRASLVTADLCGHHIDTISRGGNVQKGTCPSPLSRQHSFSVWVERKQQQKFPQDACSKGANVSRQANLAYWAALAGVSFDSHSLGQDSRANGSVMASSFKTLDEFFARYVFIVS